MEETRGICTSLFSLDFRPSSLFGVGAGVGDDGFEAGFTVCAAHFVHVLQPNYLDFVLRIRRNSPTAAGGSYTHSNVALYRPSWMRRRLETGQHRQAGRVGSGGATGLTPETGLNK